LRARLALAAILLAAFVFAATGLDWGLPYAWHPDEKVSTATEMIARGSADPDYFVNPSLHLYLVWGAVHAAYATQPGAVVPAELSKQIPLTHPDAPDRRLTFLAYRLARLVSVAFAVLTVWLVWRRGRAAFNRAAGLLAAAGLAATMGLANLAHFATPETTLFFIVLAALGGFEAVAVDATPRRYAVAGLLLGLASSTKYTVALLAVPFLAAHVAASRRLPLARAVGLVALAAACSIAGFVAATPYSILSHRRFLEDLAFNWTTGAPGGQLVDQHRSYGQYMLTLANALGWPLFVSAAAAAAWTVLRARSFDPRGRAAAIVHGVWIAAFFAFLGFSPHHALRFIMPVVPSLMILAGAGAAMLLRSPARVVRLATAAIAAAALAYSVAYTAAMDRKFVKDPRYAAGEWLARHARPGASVGYFTIESYTPYFDRPEYTVQYFPEMAQYHINGERFRRWTERVFESGPDLLVDSSFYYERFRDAPRFAERADFYARLFSGQNPAMYRPVARFAIRSPTWLDPVPELAAPEIVIFARPGTRWR
jgi:dolichyl-phosphate-mannose-protein mannosyltransferase